MNNITTSNTGGRKEMLEMLEFCARHKIGATVKERELRRAPLLPSPCDRGLRGRHCETPSCSVPAGPMSEINEALQDLEKMKGSFRYVLTNPAKAD